MQASSKSVDISVVIVGWNAKRYLELCLESLVSAPLRRSIEVLVVDNASSDGTAEMIETKFPWVKLLKSAENLGSGAIHRAGES
jgi:GT2 family glycosyltransferase